jgi:hypothetical protein
VRKWLGRFTLLLGVLLVAGAGWYGATSLLDDGGADHTPAPPACSPATRQQAKVAQRAFTRRYAEKRWVSGYGLRKKDGGTVLFVVTTKAAPDGLPECISDVPVVFSPSGPFRPD